MRRATSQRFSAPKTLQHGAGIEAVTLSAKGDANAVANSNAVNVAIGRGGENAVAVGPRGSAMLAQARRVSENDSVVPLAIFCYVYSMRSVVMYTSFMQQASVWLECNVRTLESQATCNLENL